ISYYRSITASGSYTVEYTDANGCKATSAAIAVTVNALPAVPTITSGGPTTFCDGESVVLTSSEATGNVWSNGGTDQAITVTASGSYTVEYTDANGCKATSAATAVTVNPIPTLDAGSDQTVCAGSSITLSGSGAIAYSWDNGIIDNTAFVPSATTTYTVTGTDANNCTGTDDVVITVNSNPTVIAGLDQTICAGESVTLTGSGATSYSWDNGIIDNTAFVPSSTTTYTVTGTDGAGCIRTDDVVVTVNPLPIVNAGPDQTVCVGTSVTLAGSGAATYSWDNGITDNTPFFVSATTTYSLTGTDANSCSATDDIQVTVTAIGNIYVDDFESQGSWTGDFGNTNGLWNITSGPTTSLSTGPSGAHSGNKYFYFETSAGGLNSGSIVSSAIDLTSLNDATVLSFWLHAYGVGIGTLNVGIRTTPTSSFTNIYTISDEQTNSSSEPFQKISIDITAYNGQTVYLQLNHVRTTSGGTSWEGDLAVDLLEVKSCVSCIAPTNIAVANITASSADLSWIAGGTETAWNLEYGSNGFSQNSGTTVNLNAANYTFTSLDASTIYRYYLQSHCGSEQSVWLGPYDFQTSIAAPNGITCSSGSNNFNLNTGFELGASGWSNTGSGWSTAVTSGNSSLSGPASAHQGTQWAGFDAPTFSNNTGSLISPSVDLTNSLNSAELSFYLHAFGTNNGTLDIGVSNNVSGPFTNVFTWSGAIQTANTD
ncbi:MAG: fibronectin type III domain-containing protein, partial [Methylophagaceae bacterium]